MGRRSKNKQAAPEPIENPELKSKKQLGKRKADADDADGKPSPRPAKKVKDLNGKSKGKTSGGHKTGGNPNKKNKAPVVEAEEGDDDSEGWEDVDDSPLKPTATRYALACIILT